MMVLAVIFSIVVPTVMDLKFQVKEPGAYYAAGGIAGILFMAALS